MTFNNKPLFSTKLSCLGYFLTFKGGIGIANVSYYKLITGRSNWPQDKDLPFLQHLPHDYNSSL